MPQLVPFYFTNQVVFAFILLVAIVYIFSKYILPTNFRTFFLRKFSSNI